MVLYPQDEGQSPQDIETSEDELITITILAMWRAQNKLSRQGKFLP